MWQLVICLIKRGQQNVRMLLSHQKHHSVVAWWGEKLAIDLKEYKPFEEALKWIRLVTTRNK